MKNLLIVVALLTTAATFYSALWYKSETIETDITTRVTTALAEDGGYAEEVHVDGRHVTLSGVVYDEAAETKYLGIADETFGALGPIDGLTYQADNGYLSATKTDSGITLGGTVPNEDIRSDIIANATAATDGEIDDQLVIGGPVADWQGEAAFGVSQMSQLASGTLTAAASGYALSGQPHGSGVELEAAFADREGWQTFIAPPSVDASLDDELARLTADLDTSRSEIETLQAEVTNGEATAQDLEMQVTAAQNSVALATADLAERDEQIRELNAEVDLLSQSNVNLTDELAASGRRLTGADALIASLSSNIDGQSNETTALTARVAELEGELAARSNDIGATEEQVGDLRRQLEGTNTSIETLTADVAQRDGTIADLTSEVDRLTSEADSMSRDLEAIEQTANLAVDEQVAALNAQVTDLSEQVSARDATIDELNATIADTGAELERVTQDLADRDETITGLEAEVATSVEEGRNAVTALNDEIAQREATIVELNSALTGVESEVDGLTVQLADRDEALSDQSSQVVALTAAVVASEANASTLQETIDALEGAVSERDTSIANLQGQLDTAVEDGRTQTAALSEQVETDQAQLASLQGEIGDLTAVVAERDATIAALQSQSQGTLSRADQCAAQASAVMEGSRINFGSATARIEQESIPLLERLTGIALACVGDDLVVEVGGHTDAQGTEAVNQELSEARAAAVVSFMVERGVSEGGLRAVGFGESQPIADNNTAAGRAENRRISFDWQAR